MSKAYGSIYMNMVKPLIDRRESIIHKAQEDVIIVACNWIDVIVNEFGACELSADIDENNDIIISIVLEDMIVDNNKHIFYRLLPLTKRLDIEHLSEDAFKMNFVFDGRWD